VVSAVPSHCDRLKNHDDERQTHRELENQAVMGSREGEAKSMNGKDFSHEHLPGTFGPLGLLPSARDPLERNIMAGRSG
jgi:hypothetical protein